MRTSCAGGAGSGELGGLPVWRPKIYLPNKTHKESRLIT